MVNKKRKITGKMTLDEVIQKHPETAQLFFKHGMTCLGCPMAMHETIEQGCKAHGLDVKKFLAELNKKLQKQREKEQDDN